MAQKILTAAFIRTAPKGKHSDGGGLWAYVRDSGAIWVLRYASNGRRREMSLGPLRTISLQEARERAAHWRTELAKGRDPIKTRERETRAAARADISFAMIARESFEARKAELKGDGLAGRWWSPLEHHAIPKLGRIPLDEIDARDIRDALAPIWHSGDVARKALNRIGIVLKHGAALGLAVDLQAPMKARALLGKSRHEPRHIGALNWREVPKFYASLAEHSPVNLALRFLILTGVRSMPCRFLRQEQINGDVWTIPVELVKGQKGKTTEFRVPLSREALTVIEAAKSHERHGFLFPSTKDGSPISDMSMSQMMARRGLKERPHGFRTSLRTWLADATDAPHEVAETMLGHATGTAVSRAYQRSDFLEQRRLLLERWADHVTGGTGAVLQLAAAR